MWSGVCELVMMMMVVLEWKPVRASYRDKSSKHPTWKCSPLGNASPCSTLTIRPMSAVDACTVLVAKTANRRRAEMRALEFIPR